MLSTSLSTDTPRVYVVVVHFGDATVTDRAVQGLLHGSVVPQQVIIIDHGTTPYRLERLSEARVRVIRPTENTGYGGGVSLGLGSLLASAIQKQDIVVVLNNDCVVSEATMRVLVDQWVQYPEPKLVGAQYGQVDLFTGRAVLAKKESSWHSRPYLDGAFLAASYDTWLVLKGMPDRYFLYWEDVALSWQAARRGIQLLAWPQLVVTHTVSSHVSTDKLYYLVRNGAVVLERMAPWPWPVYWWLRNRLRWAYHRDPVIKAALADAVFHRLGKRTL